jgi:hypothetical protein
MDKVNGSTHPTTPPNVIMTFIPEKYIKHLPPGKVYEYFEEQKSYGVTIPATEVSKAIKEGWLAKEVVNCLIRFS